MITLLVVSGCAACSPAASDEAPEDEKSPAAVWVDDVPAGVKVVDKGKMATLGGPDSAPRESLGVILENTTDKPMVMRVDFAVWDTTETEAWLQSPKDRPIFVAVAPKERVGTGDTLDGTEADKTKVADKFQVKVTKYTKDTYRGEPVGFSDLASAEPAKALTATPTKFYDPNMVEFAVDNPYSSPVEGVGVGMVILDPDGKVSGGWNYRPGEKADINKTKFSPKTYPPGETTEEIARGALSPSWELDESTVQIYMWARV